MDSPFQVLVLFGLLYCALTLCLVSIAASIVKQFNLRTLSIAATAVPALLGVAVFALRRCTGGD
jgi:hypothetical protein